MERGGTHLVHWQQVLGHDGLWVEHLHGTLQQAVATSLLLGQPLALSSVLVLLIIHLLIVHCSTERYQVRVKRYTTLYFTVCILVVSI